MTPSSRPSYSRSSTPDPSAILDFNNNNNNINKISFNNNNSKINFNNNNSSNKINYNNNKTSFNNNTPNGPEMRERVGRREGREIPEREVFERQEPRVRRKVSRVESLKRILFSRGTSDNEEKKRRSKSAEAEVKRSTVDKGCGPDSGLSSEGDEILTPRASCLDLTSEIGEFDSVSQISCMDSHDRWHFVRRNGSMSVSSDLLSTGLGDDHSTVVSSASQKRGQFPYAYLKSKLSPLPEELVAAGQRTNRANSESGGGGQAASQSEVGSKVSGLAPSQRLKMLAIRRKKSQSLADLHQNAPMVISTQVRGPALDKGCGSSSKHEESGYDSDTRKSAETVSPKSSDKSDESDSAKTSGSFTSGDVKDSGDEAGEPHYQIPRRGAGEFYPHHYPPKSS